MAARPAKRQRRSTAISSDDDGDFTIKSSRLPVRAHNVNTKQNTEKKSTSLAKVLQTTRKGSLATVQTNSTRSSPNSSPQKTRKPNKLDLAQTNTKSLHSFFSRATEEQRWQRRANTPQQESQPDFIEDDIVDDDPPDEDLGNLSQSHLTQQAGPSTSQAVINGASNRFRSPTPVASQKFTKPALSSAPTDLDAGYVAAGEHAEKKPWADRFGPSGLDELAVHKKKVSDVQKWVEDVSSGRSLQKILVLKGPAGSGKSTTLTLIAQTLGIEVIPWQNPTVSDTGSGSAVQQFADYLDRGGQYEALSFNIGDLSSVSKTASRKRLLLMEEFPTTMTRSLGILEAFRSILLQHILSSPKMPQFGGQKSHQTEQHPLVLLISETLLTSSTALSDSFTAHRLLGPELVHHPLVSVIEFNPVAPTFMSKALDLVIKKEASETKRRRIPGPAVLQQLAEVGDIRSAINSLEFLCSRGDNAANWSGTVAARSKRTNRGNVPLTEVEKNTLRLISQRESTLDMFHATGKIVYNKREDPRVLDSRAEPPPKPPDHLLHLYTPKVSQVDVDELLNETGTDIQTFVSTLHENYVLSCNSDDFVDFFDACARHLSDSDFLNPDSRGLVRSKGTTRTYAANLQAGNFDMLRQDEISFQVASRGLLFSLPFPVNRAVPAGTRKQDAFKMFYPASLRLWKPAEEINDLVSLYANSIDESSIASISVSKSNTGVASWKSRDLNFGIVEPSGEALDDVNGFSRSFISRSDLVTELLPYLTMILSAQGKDVQVLKKITQLRGISITGDEVLDEEEYLRPNIPSATARLKAKVEAAHNLLLAQKRNAGQNSFGDGAQHRGGREVEAFTQEKLYISDDDIQDD